MPEPRLLLTSEAGAELGFGALWQSWFQALLPGSLPGLCQAQPFPVLSQPLEHLSTAGADGWRRRFLRLAAGLNKTPPVQVFLGFREDLEACIAKLKGAARLNPCVTRP